MAGLFSAHERDGTLSMEVRSTLRKIVSRRSTNAPMSTNAIRLRGRFQNSAPLLSYHLPPERSTLK
eukprot:5189607-Prymnesium_polylepis.1